MDREAKRQKLAHYAASTVGGFMGGYAIFNFCDLFANAQTANMIHLVCKIFSADFSGLAFVVASFVTYIAGNVFCVAAEKYFKTDLKLISFVMTSMAIVAVGLVSALTESCFALVPILFVMPIQWNAYRTAAGYVSATIFSTNNLRQATMSLSSYLMDRDKKQLDKAKFYWTTLLCFHLGVAFVCVLSVFLGASSIWFGFVPLAASVAAYCNMIGFRFKVIRYMKKDIEKQYKYNKPKPH